MSSRTELAAELDRFGANIRRERNARNLTQEKLAELADLNIRTIQKIEAGELNVLITTAIRLQHPRKLVYVRVVAARLRGVRAVFTSNASLASCKVRADKFSEVKRGKRRADFLP